MRAHTHTQTKLQQKKIRFDWLRLDANALHLMNTCNLHANQHRAAFWSAMEAPSNYINWPYDRNIDLFNNLLFSLINAESDATNNSHILSHKARPAIETEGYEMNAYFIPHAHTLNQFRLESNLSKFNFQSLKTANKLCNAANRVWLLDACACRCASMSMNGKL